MEQSPITSSSSAAPLVQTSSPVATPLSSSAASPLVFSSPTVAGEHTLFNPHNTPFLQPMFDAASVSVAVAIISLSHTHQVISLKLTNTNYLYWRMQMMSYLLGQGVFSFVDDSNACPSPHVLAADGTSLQVNLLFLRWKQHDQLILSALLSSLSSEVLHLVVGYQTSCSTWHILLSKLSLPPQTLVLCNFMALFRIFDRVMNQ